MQVGLLVGFPPGAFLLMGMLLAWLLKKVGGAGFVQDEHSAPVVMPGFEGDDRVDSISGPWWRVKRVRLNRKTPPPLVGHGFWEIQSRPRGACAGPRLQTVDQA